MEYTRKDKAGNTYMTKTFGNVAFVVRIDAGDKAQKRHVLGTAMSIIEAQDKIDRICGGVNGGK